MIDAHAAGFKPAGEDGRGKDAQQANQLETSRGENPSLTTLVLSLPTNRGFASSAPRPPAARCGRHDHTMYANDSTTEDSRQISSGCHGCHAPVTPRGVTPYRPPQTLYLPAGGGVTGVTARFQLIARTQARVRTPALPCISRIRAVTPVTPPLNGGVTPPAGRKGVTPPGVTPRDPPVTPPRWSS